MEDVVKSEYQKSVFTGSMLGLLGVNLATGLVTTISLGIAYPWLLCWKESWFKAHTYINGRQLCFNGTGLQLIGNWLKWWLLSAITLGIYSLWLPIKIEQWTVKHTYFADDAMAIPPVEAEFNFSEWLGSMTDSAKAFLRKVWNCLNNWVNIKTREANWMCSDGHHNDAENRFCNICGEQKTKEFRCPNCGALITTDAKFCGSCAFPVNKR